MEGTFKAKGKALLFEEVVTGALLLFAIGGANETDCEVVALEEFAFVVAGFVLPNCCG